MLEDLPVSPDLLLTALLVEPLTPLLVDALAELLVDPLTPLLDELLKEFLDDPLTAERPTLDLPLFEDLYDPELLPDLLLLSPE